MDVTGGVYYEEASPSVILRYSDGVKIEGTKILLPIVTYAYQEKGKPQR